MSPRRSLLAGLLAAVLIAVASPAIAVTPKAVIPGWSPIDPPADRAALVAQLAEVTYAVSCGSVTATGWSADVYDDPAPDGWKALLVTTSSPGAACASNPAALRVLQGALTLEARPYGYGTVSGVGTVEVREDRPYIDWDFVPTPRVGQWVGIAARGVNGEALPLLERRIAEVGTASFAMTSPVDAAYVGAPVVDNQGRALGTMTAAGAVVTGAPTFCDDLFICTDPTRVWWDITAPSEVTDVKAVAGRGFVTFTWKAAASDGGAPASYWYRVGKGPVTLADRFRVKVPARKGQRVMIAISTINEAGPGPTVTITARAR